MKNFLLGRGEVLILPCGLINIYEKKKSKINVPGVTQEQKLITMQGERSFFKPMFKVFGHLVDVP